MKIHLLFLFSLLASSSLQSQHRDTTIFNDHFSLTFDKYGRYESVKSILTDSVLDESIQFAGFVKEYLQVLDQDGNLHYLDTNFQTPDSGLVHRRLSPWMCDIVPSYTIYITDTLDNFLVSKITYPTNGTKRKPEELFRIPHERADSLKLILGNNKFSYDQNVYFYSPMDQDVVFVHKGETVFFADNLEEAFEKIEVLYFEGLIKVKKDGLFGYYGLTAYNYVNVSPFEFHLAKAIKTNGKAVFLDRNRNEYAIKGKEPATNLLTNGSLEGSSEFLRGWYFPNPKEFNHPDPHYTEGNTWEVEQIPQDGLCFRGLVVRDDGSSESLAQKLEHPLQKDQQYEITLFLSHSVKMRSYSPNSRDQKASFNTPAGINIYAGKSLSNRALIFTSSEVINQEWIAHTFEITPRLLYKRLWIEAYHIGKQDQFYNGNILIDNISIIKK